MSASFSSAEMEPSAESESVKLSGVSLPKLNIHHQHPQDDPPKVGQLDRNKFSCDLHEPPQK